MSMTTIARRKPAQVAAEATVIVQTTTAYTMRDIITRGLETLGETRSSLFGYGVRGLLHDPDQTLPAGDYTVYANRD